MTAQEAVDKGFATSVNKSAVKNEFDLKFYNNVPQSLRNEVDEPAAEVQSEVTETTAEPEIDRISLLTKQLEVNRRK